MFISPNILRLYDRVLADSFPLLSTLFFWIDDSENDQKLKKQRRSDCTRERICVLCFDSVFFSICPVQRLV